VCEREQGSEVARSSGPGIVLGPVTAETSLPCSFFRALETDQWGERPDAGCAGHSLAVGSETALWSQVAACLGERVMVYPYGPMGGHCLG
jgi:hypothetical protein